MIISSPADFRLAAKRRLPRFLFDYADGGANAEQTLGRNVADLEGISLRQRVLQGGSKVDLRTIVCGTQLTMPVALGPIGIAGMYRRRGEVQAARAARAAGIPFCLSTVSLCSLKEVIQGAGNETLWLQLYVVGSPNGIVACSVKLQRFRHVEHLHVQTLTVKWWVSLPEWLRFGSAAHLLRVLSSCVDNLFRFWQCVVERMKPYQFYFLDPRLVSIDWQARESCRSCGFAND